MRPKDQENFNQLVAQLEDFHAVIRPLPGLIYDERRNTFVEQIIESLHRVEYVRVIRRRNLVLASGSPSSDAFNPLKAALLALRNNQLDEACWLVFLFVHFGKNSRSGWRLLRDVYGRLGGNDRWDWATVSADVDTFKEWLYENQATLRGGDGIHRGFGNHRKYESLGAYSAPGTGAVVESYVEWVGEAGHLPLLAAAFVDSDGTQTGAFDYLYHTMDSVRRFGRTGRFDYLTMIGKLGISDIRPGRTYLQGSTGPIQGARLLFDGSPDSGTRAASLEEAIAELDEALQLGDFSMQVLEDSLCNWQKSPAVFRPFRG